MKPIGPTSRYLRGLSRRDVLWTGGTGLAAGLLAPSLVGQAIKQSSGAGVDMQVHAPASSFGVPRAPYQKAAPLIEPEVRRSVNGELRTTLHVRYAYKDIGGYRLYLRSYEGTIPGPTLRVRPGDVLRIRLVNDLPPNPDPVPRQHGFTAPLQHDELPFPRIARQSGRNRRQYFSIDGAWAEL